VIFGGLGLHSEALGGDMHRIMDYMGLDGYP